GYDVVDFEKMFERKPVEWITTAGVDGLIEPIEHRLDFAIPEEDFENFKNWYLAFSEKRELLGHTNHLLYICKKIVE
ncbi:MAG: SAM-dependent methyltransferase, partial [Pseudobutyrivibrio sp.]|nr:SAM-dependent methyltransferase [Pseudobutyrivibrio sp.]